jgi:hypothetical protein
MTSNVSKCCSFAITKNEPWWQAIFVCLDCQVGESQGMENHCICEACANSCHANHDVEYIGMGPSTCDCRVNFACCLIESSSKRAEELLLGVQDTTSTSDLDVTTDNNNQLEINVQPLISPREIIMDERTNFIEAKTYRILDLIECNQPDNQCGLHSQLTNGAIELVQFCRHDTFWIPRSHNGEGLCILEKLALSTMMQHESTHNLEDVSGAEWWVQVKETQQSECLEFDRKASIDLHYDKDESLAEEFGLGSFPTLSTVTYLSDLSYPTLIFSRIYEEPEDAMISSMVVCHPKVGKHLVFDGRLLHGAPACSATMMMKNHNEERNENEFRTDSGCRITFLVNIWRNRKPSGISPLNSSIRQHIERKLNMQEHVLLSSITLERLIIEKRIIADENDFLPENGQRIILPFVSKGATWIDDNDDDDKDFQNSNLVLVTFPPPHHECETLYVHFGPGMEAYLEHEIDDDEDEEYFHSDCNQVAYI